MRCETDYHNSSQRSIHASQLQPTHRTVQHRLNHTASCLNPRPHVRSTTLSEICRFFGLINNLQHSFLSQRSCTTCQLSRLSHISELIDSDYAVVILFLNIRQAFDRVPHKPSSQKLENFEIRDTLICCRSLYLIGRKQVVPSGEYRSSPRPITSGSFKAVCSVLHSFCSTSMTSPHL
ncbi:unnamed protein product [Dicrocoelium dendriticum]|nr:unnamed protein product [Dicrocoelium dendriticum]